MKVDKIEISEGITNQDGKTWKKREVKYESTLDESEGSDLATVLEKTKALREIIQTVIK
jgi:hypothetical protein